MTSDKSGKAKMNKLEQLAVDLAVGCAAGAIAQTAAAPFQNIVLLARQSNHGNVIEPYTGIMHFVKCICKEHGVLAFWRGNMINCLRYAPQKGSILAINDATMFPKYNSRTQFWESLASKLFSGGLAGAVVKAIAYPYDFFRSRLAYDLRTKGGQFKGIWDCISTTVKQQGITGLYTGLPITVAGAFVYNAGQLAIFKQIQDLNPYQSHKGTLGFISSFVAAITARAIIMPFYYPLDTIRRHLMMESEKPKAQRKYRGSLDSARQILAKGGLKSMYRAMSYETFRIGGSLVVVAYDRTKVIFDL